MAHRLTARAKAARDEEVVRDRLRGFRWGTVAQRHGLSERQCRTIWQEHLKSQPLVTEADPLELAAEVLGQLETLVEDAAVLAETSPNGAVRIAALKLRHAALLDLLTWRQGLGLLPQNLGRLKEELDVQRFSKAVAAAFEEYDVPLEALDAVQRLLREASIRPNGTGPTAR